MTWRGKIELNSVVSFIYFFSKVDKNVRNKEMNFSRRKWEIFFVSSCSSWKKLDIRKMKRTEYVRVIFFKYSDTKWICTFFFLHITLTQGQCQTWFSFIFLLIHFSAFDNIGIYVIQTNPIKRKRTPVINIVRIATKWDGELNYMYQKNSRIAA